MNQTELHWRTVIHFRVVNDEDGGIMFSADSNDGIWGRSGALARAQEWARVPGYHVEEWEQTYAVTDSTWRRVDA